MKYHRKGFLSKPLSLSQNSIFIFSYAVSFIYTDTPTRGYILYFSSLKITFIFTHPSLPPSIYTDNLYVMSPVFSRDSMLLTLPFGGAVLRSLGMSQPEVEAIMDDFRRVADDEKNYTDDTFNFLNSYGVSTASIAIVPEKKEKDRERDLERDKDKHDTLKKMERDRSWDGTEEQERQEEEQEMHEYSRISRILYERSYQKDVPKKSSMNGMIGGQEEREVELTDSPVAVYLDGPDALSASSAVAPVVDEVPERIVPAQNLR